MESRMKFLFALLAVLFLGAPCFAQQSINDLNFINGLDRKERSTFGDAVRFIALDMGTSTSDFNSALSTLNRKNIAKGYEKLGQSTPLRRGVIARMIARYLDLNDSLWYIIFGTERYAFRACVSEGIMPSNASEWDSISGSELIEIMTRVSERSGGN